SSELGLILPKKQGILNRRLIKQEIRALNSEKDLLSGISQKWPVLNNNLEQFEAKKTVLNQAIEHLDAELKRTSQKEEADKLKERLARLQRFQTGVNEARREVDEAVKVTGED